MKKFETPEIKTIKFDVEDVISSSQDNGPAIVVNGLPVG